LLTNDLFDDADGIGRPDEGFGFAVVLEEMENKVEPFAAFLPGPSSLPFRPVLKRAVTRQNPNGSGVSHTPDRPCQIR
jgi:hypothetical protein